MCELLTVFSRLSWLFWNKSNRSFFLEIGFPAPNIIHPWLSTINAEFSSDTIAYSLMTKSSLESRTDSLFLITWMNVSLKPIWPCFTSNLFLREVGFPWPFIFLFWTWHECLSGSAIFYSSIYSYLLRPENIFGVVIKVSPLLFDGELNRTVKQPSSLKIELKYWTFATFKIVFKMKNKTSVPPWCFTLLKL